MGENSKAGDLEVNPVRAKATSNMRTQSKEEKLYLAPPKRMSVEELIGKCTSLPNTLTFAFGLTLTHCRAFSQDICQRMRSLRSRH